MEFKLLADNLTEVPTVARWLNSEWGDPSDKESIRNLESRLRDRASRDKIPVHLLAYKDNLLVGFGVLKIREMDIYPDFEHWLGSLYVIPQYRGKGIGKALIKEIVTRAISYGVTCLYLQTEKQNIGLYQKLGWVLLDQVKYKGYDASVMRLDLLEKASLVRIKKENDRL